MKLIIEPDNGMAPILSAIEKAKESIDVTIFRFDRKDVEAALRAAVGRGVKITALVAYANRGGQKQLRKLEMRFLQAGITVARTADDLIRYHNKLLIIDRQILYVLSFNFTHLDVAHSRSFGIATRNTRLVQEAAKLFESDCARAEYTSGLSTLIVSPTNARKELGAFIKRARQQLLIYDPQVSDDQMTQLIKERAKAGVDVRIIGHVKSANLESKNLSGLRLHTRAIIRDRRHAFIGSQSLRAIELDRRREVGIVIHEPKIVKSLLATFESDWAATDSRPNDRALDSEPADVESRDADRVARTLIKELRPIAMGVKRAVKKAVAKAGDEALHDEKVKDTVKKVVKRAVKDAVKEVGREAKSAKRASV